MTGQGGWPLNVFLTPEQVPFYAGTYFPPEPRHGHAQLAPGARARSTEAWQERRDEIAGHAEQTRASACSGGALLNPSERAARPELGSTAAVEALRGVLRPARTAASAARPSSRPPRRSSSCCAAARRDDERAHTLRAMASGGMYDQIGGGFARYSVDPHWIVPHFEKMLYDNALLARAYLHGWQVTGEPLFERVCRETLDWAIARDARRPRAASTPRWTPTPRAWRASSTSGRSTSCASCSATTPRRPSSTSA